MASLSAWLKRRSSVVVGGASAVAVPPSVFGEYQTWGYGKVMGILSTAIHRWRLRWLVYCANEQDWRNPVAGDTTSVCKRTLLVSIGCSPS